jgi:hypothetical protein
MVTSILCGGYAEVNDIDRSSGQEAQGGYDMNRVVRMVPFRTLSIILIVAGVLAAAGFVARAIWIAAPGADLEVEDDSEASAPIAVETEVDNARRAPSAPPHRWLPDEIGAGLPGIVVEDEGALGAEDDVMSLGRYLETERAPERAAPPTMLDFQRQKLAETQADDAPVGSEWPESECEPASPTGPQPC